MLPLALLALGTMELAFSGLPNWGWGTACFGLASVCLVPRRKLPLVAGPLAAWALALGQVIESELTEPAAPIAVIVVGCYAAARYRADLWGIAALVVMLASAFPQYFLTEETNDITDVFFVGALLVPPFIFGRVARKLDEQTHLLEAQQAALQAQAVRAERDRIARELHDVIAHSVSAMVVQTAAARDLVTSDPTRAQLLLDGVAGTGRRALAETARLLHVIRDDADELGLEPVPGVVDLDRLIDEFADSGLQVDMERSGDLSGLPAGVDVSTYRVVQEALTNAHRYGAGPVSLVLQRDNGLVRIAASNAVGAATTTHGAGLGLMGMAERASLLGGNLEYAVRAGRFELKAELPVVEG